MTPRALVQVVLEALGFVPDGGLVGLAGWAPLTWGRVVAPGVLGEVQLELDLGAQRATYRVRHVRRDGGGVTVADLGFARSLLAAQRLCLEGGQGEAGGLHRGRLAGAGGSPRQHPLEEPNRGAFRDAGGGSPRRGKRHPSMRRRDDD